MAANAQQKDYLSRLFSKDLAENLFPANEFYQQSMDDKAFVDGDEVILPHAGTEPTVVKNRDGNGEVSSRRDTHIKYDLHEFTTDPTKLQFSEDLLAKYNKRASILHNHKSALQKNIAEYIAAEWAKANLAGSGITITRTSGQERPSSVGTGTRKGIVLADLLAISQRFNQDDVPLGMRYGLITPAQLNDILQIPEVKSADFNNGKPLVDGTVGNFLGINFFVRSSANRFTAGAGAVREAGGTLADTDCAGALFWSKSFVRKAEGTIKVFFKSEDPEVYGDIYSCLVRAGASKARKDNRGIYNLIEDTPAA